MRANGYRCTTSGAEGLHRQLTESHVCAYPGQFMQLSHPNITLNSSRVYMLFTMQAAHMISQAANRTSLHVTSAYRGVAQQYQLYRSYQNGGCGLAATPGSSSHQGGRAIDVSNYSAKRRHLEGQGCGWLGSRDPVHFNCGSTNRPDLAVEVFQKLWNLNNPHDPIAEDGSYGPQTRSRLARSPARGFARSLCDVVEEYGAEFVAQSFPVAADPPLELAPGEEVTVTLELRNSGSLPWDSSTRLGTTGPRDVTSPLAASDWDGPNRPASVRGTVQPGDTYVFEFSLRGPEEPGEYRQTFGVVQERVTWFSDDLGPPDDQLEVKVLVVRAAASDAGVAYTDGGTAPGHGADAGGPVGVGTPETGAEEGAPHRSDPEMLGGCSLTPVGAPASGALPLWGIALAWLLRSRRSAARRKR